MTEEHDPITAPQPSPEPTGRASDPVASLLLVIALSLIVVLLATTAAFYIYLQTLNRAPRTLAERDVATWEIAVAEKPNDANAWANLAYAYADAGRYDDAVDAAENGQIKTDEPVLVLVEADVLRVGGRYKEAMDAYGEAEKAVKEQMKKTADKRREVGVTSDLNDDSMLRVYFGRGVSNHELGDLDAAIQDLERAVKLAPAQVNVVVALGDFYAEDGKTEKAQAMYKRALEYVPDYAPALKGLQRLEGGG